MGQEIRFPHSLNGLVRLTNDELLALTVRDGVWIVNSKGRKLRPCAWAGPALVSITMGVQDRQGRAWLGGESGLYEVLDIATNPHLERKDRIGNSSIVSVLDLALDREGRLWVAHPNGLSCLQGQKWIEISLQDPSKGVGSLAVAEKSIWLTSLTPGFFSRLDPRRTSTPGSPEFDETRFDSSNGHLVPTSVWLHTDSRKWIWRATEDGVMVARADKTEPLHWLHLGSANGFPWGRLRREGFAETGDGRVWLMGLRQSAKLMPDGMWFSPSRDGSRPVMSHFSQTGRNATVKVGGIGANDLFNFPIQYRLLGLHEDWRGSQNGNLVFSNLPDDLYRLEVRFGGDSSAATTAHEFRVGPDHRGLLVKIFIGSLALALAAWGTSHLIMVRRWHHKRNKAKFLLQHTRQFPNIQTDALSPDNVLLDRYVVCREIARGGFSLVYQAWDRQLRSFVAIKLVPMRPDIESWLRQRHAQEIAALSSINHPRVVPILDSWVGSKGECLIVMPYLEGPSLRDKLDSESLSSLQAASILIGIAEALEASHRVGVIHLDVKPENILVVGDSSPVLLDFGTSGFRGPEQSLAVTRMLAGSAHDMAPERLTGHYSSASDIYSLGVVAVELFTGKHPVEFQNGSFDPAFELELRSLLAPNWSIAASPLAAAISEALRPIPRTRPSSVLQWASSIAALADQARGPRMDV
jgi:predicted Ser/Thr protein kinase